MIALITTSIPALDKIREQTMNVGRLFTPRMTGAIKATVAKEYPWAADCDGFRGVDTRAYIGMLSRLPADSGCLFVVPPDRVANARATLRLFLRWEPLIHELNLPVAYVLQDGLEGAGVPWDLCDALFIGGTTHFKLSAGVARTVREGKKRGKWVHMGRVNAVGRATYARSIDCDSFDGSSWGRFPEINLTNLLGILEPGKYPSTQTTEAMFA